MLVSDMKNLAKVTSIGVKGAPRGDNLFLWVSKASKMFKRYGIAKGVKSQFH